MPHRPYYAFEVLCSQVMKLKQITDELAGALRNDHRSASAMACKGAARFGVRGYRTQYLRRWPRQDAELLEVLIRQIG